MFKCPLCVSPLKPNEKQLTCKNRHSFDIAKEGYVNLHVAQKKRSKQPGDNEEMIRSRQQFLNGDYYYELVTNLIDNIQQLCLPDHSSLLDNGCGEGYYLEKIRQAYPSMPLAGIDISKIGIKLSAKRNLRADLAVASAYELPFFENRFTAAISIFSPFECSEIARVLKKNGYFIAVGPGPNHLKTLAECVYDKHLSHQGNFKALEHSSHFETIKKLVIKARQNVPQKDLKALLTMTPYYWRTKPEQKDKLFRLPKLEVPLEFSIRIVKKI